MEIELGDLVKDVITGFQGIAVSKHIFLTGCNRWGVQPIPKNKKEITEKKIDTIAFDELQLTVVKKEYVKIPEMKPAPKESHRSKGGPVALPPEKEIERR